MGINKKIELLFLFMVGLLSSCLPSGSSPKYGSQLDQGQLVEGFVSTSYDESAEEIQAIGISSEHLRRYVSVSLYQNLKNLSKAYQSRMDLFSAGDQVLLVRLFTSEVNFAVLRPWSYQPSKDLKVQIVNDSNSTKNRIEMSYDEIQWNDKVSVRLIADFKSEKGKLVVDDLRWMDLNKNKGIQEKIANITDALLASKTFNEFENRSRGLY